MALRIPDRFHSAWVALARLDEASLRRLRDSLKVASPQLRVDAFVREARNAVPVEDRQRGLVLEMLLSLAAAQNIRGETRASLVRSLRDFSEAMGPDFLPAIGWEKFGELLIDFVCSDAVVVTTKAEYVMSQHQRVFQKSKAFTDIRPVFAEAVEAAPLAGVMVHTLRIDYVEGGRTKSFFVALDSRDLTELQAVLARAKQKEEGITKAVGATQIRLLEDKS